MKYHPYLVHLIFWTQGGTPGEKNYLIRIQAIGSEPHDHILGIKI
jgi:hypothetical protein